MKCPGAMLHSKSPAELVQSPGELMLNRTFSIHRVFLVPLSKKKLSEMVVRDLPLTSAQPGSLALKQIDS